MRSNVLKNIKSIMVEEMNGFKDGRL